jgi:hypothetical protein
MASTTKKAEAPKNTGRFGKGNPGKPAGAVSKTTKALKEAILEAAEKSGADTKGKGGLVGYLKRVADTDVKAFSGLLGRVLPLTLAGTNPDGSITVNIKQF